MTILLGMACTDGVLMVADCLIGGPNQGLSYKIEAAVYDKGPTLSGAYLGRAGYYMLADIPQTFCRDYLVKGPNRADLLSDPLLNQQPSDYFEQLRKQKEMERYRLADESESLEADIEKLTNLFELAMLLHDTDKPSAVSYFSRMVLRLSEHYEPGLFAINGKIEEIRTFKAAGSGAKIVEPYLKDRYSPSLDLDQATQLASEAMNLALHDHHNFQGYQLVRAQKINRVNEVKTVVDCDAIIMPSHFSDFSDYRFRKNRS